MRAVKIVESKPGPTPATGPEREQLMSLLVRLLDDLEYGQIQITVHDSRIVQIEKTERHRLG